MKYPYRVIALTPKVKGLLPMLLTAVPLIVIAALPNESQRESIDPAPSPKLEPYKVVRIQVDALRKNTLLNEGIELIYRFASPDNKRYTGPIGRFTEMVRSAPYSQLLNHRNAHYGPLSISGNEASQLVTITDKAGEDVAYAWVISRQRGGEYENCWMTDAVVPVQRPAQRKLVKAHSAHGASAVVSFTPINRSVEEAKVPL